ncbi:cell division topological specificity factor MinE [Blochmannia endosymbiont of Colobopsis nipponica]|nr:cell division topological specificity factor MinE [Blochmannia endosymbiont of Colobopsis nipponica]
MTLFNFFIYRKKKSANIAKKRLQIIFNIKKKKDHSKICYYSSQFKNDLTKIIRSHIQDNLKIISIQLRPTEKNPELSELKIIITKITNQNLN